jgi:hypothetical protein
MLSLERAGRPEEVARVAEARRRPGAGPAGAKADAAATRPAFGASAVAEANGVRVEARRDSENSAQRGAQRAVWSREHPGLARRHC